MRGCASVFVLVAGMLALRVAAGQLLDPEVLPGSLDLSERQQARIAAGRSVFFAIDVLDHRYRAVAFRVAAPADSVWSAINDFGHYARWIDGVERAEVYGRINGKTYVEFAVNHWLIGTLQYSARHDYAWPTHRWGTFALDEERKSDFESASGFWGTFAVTGDREATDVVYAARLTPSRGLAKWFRGRFVRSGLKSATQWLPRAVEERRDVEGEVRAPR
ncbi:MAG: SRPBCC family protein [Pseudomonadota bacterium]